MCNYTVYKFTNYSKAIATCICYNDFTITTHVLSCYIIIITKQVEAFCDKLLGFIVTSHF